MRTHIYVCLITCYQQLHLVNYFESTQLCHLFSQWSAERWICKPIIMD